MNIEICNIFLGILIGFLIFIFFNKNKYQPQYHGPDSNEFKTKIFKLNEKCYIFKPKMYMCPQF